MAKWRVALNRKKLPYRSGHMDKGLSGSAEDTGISEGHRGRSRLRYDSRVAVPRGWRSSFMSF